MSRFFGLTRVVESRLGERQQLEVIDRATSQSLVPSVQCLTAERLPCRQGSRDYTLHAIMHAVACCYRSSCALTGPRVKFLREKLEKLGCEMPRQSFACRPCEGMDISGGFVPPIKDAKGNLSLAEVQCGAVRRDARWGAMWWDHHAGLVGSSPSMSQL